LLLQVVAAVVLGLICGSELNVAAFAHPTIGRQPLATHIQVRASLAALLGKVMPFCMVGSTVLNLLLLLPVAHLSSGAWRLAAVSGAIQVAAIPFSLIGPVPINNRIAKWVPTSLPPDWKAQERRWDAYHWLRTCALIVGFVLLVVSIGMR